METLRLNQHENKKIVSLLLSGKLIALMTDTVYGLGVIANNLESIEKLRWAKQRPQEKAFAYVVDCLEKIEQVCELTPRDRFLIQRFLPGPLTFIFKKKPNTCIIDQSDLTTLAIRIPNLPFLLNILSQMEVGIYLPSANLSGKPPTVTSEEVLFQLDKRIDGVVIGKALGEMPSTIIDCSEKELKCLRTGPIKLETIMAICQKEGY